MAQRLPLLTARLLPMLFLMSWLNQVSVSGCCSLTMHWLHLPSALEVSGLMACQQKVASALETTRMVLKSKDWLIIG